MTAALLRMYDSIDGAEGVPAGADLYAGYVNGLSGASYGSLRHRFPHAFVVSITVTTEADDAHVLDLSSGDVTPEDVPGWVLKMRAHGHTWPTVRVELEDWEEAQQACKTACIAEPHWWIVACPGTGPVLYPGAIAHQWMVDAGHDIGLNYGESVVDPSWPPILVHPAIPYPPAPGTHSPHVPNRGFNSMDVVLGLGSIGRDVVILQRALDNRGIRCIPDGRFGGHTREAVMEFQRRAGITVDGLAGPQTKRALSH